MLFIICTYEMISGFHHVNIFGLKENLQTVSQNSCSMYYTGLEKFQDTGYSFVKN